MVIILIGIILIIIIVVVFSRQKKSAVDDEPLDNIEIERQEVDKPVGFGYKISWFAIKTKEINRLADFLKLKNLKAANWQSGIESAYARSVFVTPAIGEWTLICGRGLPSGDTDDGIENIKSILVSLSLEFGEAQFFCTHRVVEYHCWIKATSGLVTRCYSYLGESGENIVVDGTATEVEKEFALVNTLSEEAQEADYFDKELHYSDEDFVMKVAGTWSVDPTKIEERSDIASGFGLLGRW